MLLCSDGDAVTLGDTLEVERRAVPAGYQYVDGILDDIDSGVLRDRRNLAEEGVVVVIVTVDAATGELITGPEIVTRGWMKAYPFTTRLRRASMTGRFIGCEIVATSFLATSRESCESLSRVIT